MSKVGWKGGSQDEMGERMRRACAYICYNGVNCTAGTRLNNCYVRTVNSAHDQLRSSAHASRTAELFSPSGLMHHDTACTAGARLNNCYVRNSARLFVTPRAPRVGRSCYRLPVRSLYGKDPVKQLLCCGSCIDVWEPAT
jgi:hypothetical protein